MTVVNERRRIRYEGNGVATSFTCDFRVFGEEDLAVYLTVPGGAEKLLTLGVDYTVSGAGGTEGCEVGFPVQGEPLPPGHFLTIVRDLAYTQEVDIQNQCAWLPEVVEGALYRLTMQGQQLLELSDRTLRYSPGSAGGPVEVPSPSGPALLGFNQNGEMIAYGLGTVSADYAGDIMSTNANKGTGLVGWEGRPGFTATDGLGKVFASAGDASPGFLGDKLAAGNGVTLQNEGGLLTFSTAVGLAATASTQATVTVTATDTDLITGVSLGEVPTGAIYLLSGQARLVKGNDSGTTVVRVLKESGTADVRFDGKPADDPDVIFAIDYVEANLGQGFFIFGMMQVLAGGTLSLKMNAMSAVSNSTLGGAGQTTASVQLIRLI